MMEADSSGQILRTRPKVVFANQHLKLDGLCGHDAQINPNKLGLLGHTDLQVVTQFQPIMALSNKGVVRSWVTSVNS